MVDEYEIEPLRKPMALSELDDVKSKLSVANMKQRAADAEINRLKHIAKRYEAVRRMNPRQFAELYQENLLGKASFDTLVDAISPKGAR